MYLLQINLISFSTITLTNFIKKIINNFEYKLKVININSSILTLLKSPHVHKKSRIQYKFKKFKYIIFFKTTNFLNILFIFKIIQKLKILNIHLNFKITKYEI